MTDEMIIATAIETSIVNTETETEPVPVMPMKPNTPMSNNKTTTNTSIYKEKLKEWAEKSSVHAIPQLVISKNYLVKLLWLGCLLLSGFFCGKTVVNNLIDYFSYSVDTVVQIDRDSNVNFPTVTICRLQICGLDGKKYAAFVEEFFKNQNDKQNLNLSQPNVIQMLKLFRVKNIFLSNF